MERLQPALLEKQSFEMKDALLLRESELYDLVKDLTKISGD
jgi:hypothetical protein